MTYELRHRFITAGRMLLVSLLLAFFLFPVYWTVTMAFKPQAEWAPTTGEVYWFPENPTLGNFKRVFDIGDVSGFGFLAGTPLDAVPPITNSIVASVGGTLLALVVGTLAAYGISRFRAGTKHLAFSILQMRMFPPIAIILPILFLFTYLKLYDTLIGLILIYGAVTFPFVVWLMRSFFDEVPIEVSQAARVDGCSRWGAFYKTVLPLSRAGLATTALFVFILNWSDFLIALVLTNEGAKTAPVFLNEIKSASTGNEFGSQAALGLVLLIPPVVIAMFIQKHLVRGLTFGAVKR